MFDLTGLQLARAVQKKEISVVEVVKAHLDKIEKNAFNAFIEIPGKQALARAEVVQKQINEAKEGDLPSPLTGLPVGVKDNISTKGIATTCGSKMLADYRPVFDATVVSKIEQAGMIVIAKLNMDEFGMGGSNETSFFGTTTNPWDTARVTGGSSGGSGAAVAGGEVLIALGTDTGGSIRKPCAFCNATGIKPTYGSVSRYGLVAFASSLDQIGPMATNIDDCAAMLSVISGPDPKDSTCIIKKPFAFDISATPKNMKGTTIGLPTNFFAGCDDDVKAAVLSAANTLKEAGATIIEFEMPLTEHMISVYYIIACAEASSNLSRYDGIKYGYRSEDGESLSDIYRMSRSQGFGLEVKRRIMLGSFVLSSSRYDTYYKKALQARSLIKSTYDGFFEKFDMIFSPVSPTTAYKIGENIKDPIKMHNADIYTVSVNLAGLPAVALPCGFDKQGLPIGFQLIGQAFCEDKLIKAGQFYQSCTNFHSKKPVYR
ncbi:MAG: Asp-tRNA(Asn)/Glu-tRNA(Gln) amidotransferase subunit GatA [Defluviitaleaceae bacterium]|nr:Asp-tRNA(Asn)/Glu-tRNA(Gln) amidotransferase subunit GatA [Defluviitaleaceae bacterium]